MIIADAGFWVALISPHDQWHERAREVFASLNERLVSTWPVMTEAAYLIAKYFGTAARLTLIDMWRNDGMDIATIERSDADRIRELDAAQFQKIVKAHAADRYERPRQDLRVSVLADDVAVHMMRIDAAVLPEQRTEPRGVERRAGTEHPPRRPSAPVRDAGREMRHDVDRIGRDNQHSTGRTVQDSGNNLLENFGVATQEL